MMSGLNIDMEFRKKEYENHFRTNLRSLGKKLPFLHDIVSKLDDKKIKYGLCGGTEVWLLTSSRETRDLDILVSDDDLENVKTLFPEAKTEQKDYGDFVYLQDSTVEFSFNCNPKFDDTVYKFRLTELAVKHLEKFTVAGLKIYLLNPADTILMKAICQRGKTEEKYDFEDIEHVVYRVKIDKEYLAKRFEECEGDERVKRCLKSHNLLW